MGCRQGREVGGGGGGEDNTSTIPVERNHLHNFMKAVFVRLDGFIKAQQPRWNVILNDGLGYKAGNMSG